MTLDGSESDAELAKLKGLKPIMVLINVDSKYVFLGSSGPSRVVLSCAVCAGMVDEGAMPSTAHHHPPH